MDDMDDLLNSALDDFRRVEISQSSAAGRSSASSNERPALLPRSDLPSPSGSDGRLGQALGQGLGIGLPGLASVGRSDLPSPSRSDENVGEALGQGLGLGLPGLASIGRKKAAQGRTGSSPAVGTTGSRAAITAASRESNLSPQRPLSATLEQLSQQTRQTVANIDVLDEDNIMGDNLVENLMKQFEDMVGTQDVQSVMDTMMGQLLSKEMLHEPMKEIGERYCEWLPANKSRLSQEDYDRFSTQYQYILQLCDVYESTPDDYQRTMDLMQQMQNCGHPPSDIMRELTPGLDLDQEGLLMMPDFTTMAPGGELNCSIM